MQTQNIMFKIGETDTNIYYAVQGTKENYEVIYNKIKETYLCSCKNVRFTDCKHIKAIKSQRHTREEEQDSGGLDDAS